MKLRRTNRSRRSSSTSHRSSRYPQLTQNKLDILSDHINIIETDFNKKLKSLKSHVDFLSHFEEYFKRKGESDKK